MKKTDIKWREGYRSKVKAEDAYAVLQGIRESHNGELTPEDVLKKAKLKRSPIHNAFEWDDEKASHKYRLEQSRGMIRSIEIVRDSLPERPTRVFEIIRVSTPNEDKPTKNVYKTTEDILADPVARDELLSRAIRDALSFRRRYHMLSELAKVIDVLDNVVSNADEMIA